MEFPPIGHGVSGSSGQRKRILRAYRRSDLEAMVDLDALCFGPEFRFDARAMLRFADGRRAHTIVAEGAPGEILGFAIVELLGGRQGRRGYCVTLDVFPAERRRGTGEELLQAGERWAAEGGADRMQLHVWVRNEGAIRFYERLGYVLRGTVPEFYGGPGMDALVYCKLLGAQDSPELAETNQG